MTDYGDLPPTDGTTALSLREDDSAAPAVAEGRTAGLSVQVWLFGALAALDAERPMRLSLPPDATAGDVVDAIGERLGRPFLDQVMAEPGEMFRCCRFFADGHPVTSLGERLAARGEAVEIEMLLLMGYEGG